MCTFDAFLNLLLLLLFHGNLNLDGREAHAVQDFMAAAIFAKNEGLLLRLMSFGSFGNIVSINELNAGYT